MCLVASDSLWPHGLYLARLLCPKNFPSKNPGVNCHFLLQGIFPTQVLNPRLLHLLHWQVDSLPMHYLRNPWGEKKIYTHTHRVQFSQSVMSDSLWPHWLQHTRPLCPSTTTGAYSNSCPLSRWCHPTISSSVIPFSSCLQSFPASGSFPVSQLMEFQLQHQSFQWLFRTDFL